MEIQKADARPQLTRSVLAVVLVAAAAVIVGVLRPGALSIVIAITATACAVFGFLPRARVSTDWWAIGGPLLPLGLIGIGVVGAGTTAGTNRFALALAIAAGYGLVGGSLITRVSSFSRMAPADLVVEALCVGAVATIAAHPMLASIRESSSGDAIVPALLIGLDIALIAIVGRGASGPAPARAPAMWVGLATVSLTAGHLVQALTDSRSASLGSTILVCGAIAAFGAASVHARMRPPLGARDERVDQFSVSHAFIVVAAVLAPAATLMSERISGTVGSTHAALALLVASSVVAVHLTVLLRARSVSAHQALHDEMTGLGNRDLLEDHTKRALAHAARTGEPVGVLSIVLDDFDQLTETLGSRISDEVVRATATHLVEVDREADLVARVSDHEFVLLAPHLKELDNAVAIAERVRARLDHVGEYGGIRIRNSVSIGVAVYPPDGDDSDTLLRHAATARRRAQATEGCSIEVFNASLAAEIADVAAVEAGLVRALENDELRLHYQPIVDTSTGRTVGAEALIRWQHPEQGLIGPGAFLPIAEQSDLIVRVGQWVLHEAAEELSRWAHHGLERHSISVNISARHFAHDLVGDVTVALRKFKAAPSNLIIELTESAAMADIEGVASDLLELQQIGVRAALDDFGTGYSSLRYLVDLPVKILKIDRSFVSAMTPQSAALVASTIAMGRTLGLTVVAEGVETVEQLRLVVDNGCDRVQGYKLGRPMPVDEFIAIVQRELAPVVLISSDREAAAAPMGF